MKVLTLLLAASIAQIQPALTITISAGQTVVTAQSPVEVQVTLKNTSNHDLRVFVDKSGKAELSDFAAEVTNPQGLVPKITAYYDQLTGGKAPREQVANSDEQFVISGSASKATIAPGATIELHMDIGKLYDLSKPGTYTIQVARTDVADGTMVKSNPLKVTVTE